MIISDGLPATLDYSVSTKKSFFREQTVNLPQKVEDSTLASFIGEVVVMAEGGRGQNSLGGDKETLTCCQLFEIMRNYMLMLEGLTIGGK